ncbi:adenosine kinase [Ahrensia sp. R2A130]|uniref:adenosine kinase n=1 Tax=Ahrensia sp. R2A130 TaxID=744979 RepID=UPI0001E0F87C|nr:adenosine kinase [Ahrensia sp. R2A130]EFL89201.1 PfkB family carbohydrate kinase [Ahrensia sp. R2A130]
MSEPKFDVLTIGNAIVDIIANADDAFLAKEDITKAAMNLIDADRAEHLYDAMGSLEGGRLEASGGSAGNTAAGLASLGSRAAYFGKVANDHLGNVFREDIRKIGVAFDSTPLEGTPPTARSMILVTPDGERSMNTYLGACVEFSPEDVVAETVAASQVTYFEGYLWDPPKAKEGIREAARIAHENDREVAMTLSDPFCVDRYRDEFLELMTSGTVDIVFANEAELLSLYQTEDFDAALDRVAKDCKLAAVTRSEKGSVSVRGDERHHVAAHAIDKLVDTTGAGDLYAAGFLHGYTEGHDLTACARIGGMAAAEVIQHLGPRPAVSLKEVLVGENF